ncbi:acyl carrier protein [Pleionea litopenaei]|uniref:Acyl carrier protein n=1 Tax=Pleionea litopenaei TaxID=3070815 RepID=A0AA51RRI0_9GAMM|nr:acyl carrier protein [Pleionea sp. HL-JVS1]WMS86210.1 acyl carrier protein [Pleionea sp. HL-JVS1]
MSRSDIAKTVKSLLVDTLSLSISPDDLNDDTPLLGNFPEFDSMAIVSVITSLEETFEFTAEDDDLTAEVFETIGSLVDFVIEQTVTRSQD